jgi:acyl-CoA dehydrogenase
MDFAFSPQTEVLKQRIGEFMDRYVYPAESHLIAHEETPTVEEPFPRYVRELREKAKAQGLWNFFLPDERYGVGVSNLQYAPLCELMGRSPIAPAVFNCQAPDTGNMEILAEYGTDEQKSRWLGPMLAGSMRSCYAMTEPDTAGSDPTGLATRAVRDGDQWVINGHKWFTTGAIGAAFAIVMTVSDPDAPGHLRASQIIVPAGTPGYKILRPISVMGHDGGSGHCEVKFEDCRVPVTNLLGPQGAGFGIAQARLGPGRINHCMRAIGGAERAIEMMCQRANSRIAFGGPLADKQFVQDFVAKSRMEVDQARLLTLHAAWKMDTLGKKAARQEISMIKVVAANMYMDVLDRAIQVWGSKGMSDDTPLALMWRQGRMLRLADGPDEVHKMVIARRELNRWKQ